MFKSLTLDDDSALFKKELLNLKSLSYFVKFISKLNTKSRSLTKGDALLQSHQTQNLRVLYSCIDTDDESRHFMRSENLLKLCLTNNICTFVGLISFCIKHNAIGSFLENSQFFKSSLHKKLISQQDLEHFINLTYSSAEFVNILYNSFLFKYILKNNLLTFPQFVDSHPHHLNHMLYNNDALFKELIDDNILSKSDVQYLMKAVFATYDFLNLLSTKSLMQYILKNALIDEQFIKKYNTLTAKKKWYDTDSPRNLFQAIQYYNSRDEQLQQFAQIYEAIASLAFDWKDKFDLIEIVFSSAQAYDRINHLMITNTLSTFDQPLVLKQHLTKIEKKNLLNI